METIYHLRPSLTWHDGRPLTGDDFVFAARVFMMPEFGAASSPILAAMDEIVTGDDRTVVFRWKQPYAEAASLDLEFQALPRHLLEQPLQSLDPQAFAGLPFWTTEYVGLGPYRIERWEPGAFVEGAAFEGHALGRPKIDRMRLVFIGDPNTALANLLSGDAHYVSESIFYTEEGLTLEQQWGPTNGGTVLYSPVTFRATRIQSRPEVASPRALLDVRVRRALAHSIDGPGTFEAVTGGRGLIMSSLTPPTKEYFPDVDRAITKYAYDARSVERLLTEVGMVKGSDGRFVQGSGEPFQVEVAADGGAVFERENTILVDSMRKVGIDAVQHIIPIAQINDNQARALLPGLSTGGLSSPRYDKFTIPAISGPENRWAGTNRSGWNNPEFDRLWQAYGTTLDPKERIAQIVQMERIFADDVPAVPHFFTPAATAYVAALDGPVTAQTPDAGRGVHRVWDWTWRS
jgi:peptide/nickel transport system substrate-binding protein